MNEIPLIITERVDDIPLLLEQMQRMGLPSLLDDHFRDCLTPQLLELTVFGAILLAPSVTAPPSRGWEV